MTPTGRHVPVKFRPVANAEVLASWQSGHARQLAPTLCARWSILSGQVEEPVGDPTIRPVDRCTLRMSWARGLFLGWNPHLPTGQKQTPILAGDPSAPPRRVKRQGWNRVAAGSLRCLSNQSSLFLFLFAYCSAVCLGSRTLRCVVPASAVSSSEVILLSPWALAAEANPPSMFLQGSKRHSANNNSRAGGIGRGRRLADVPPLGALLLGSRDLNLGLARAKERLVPEPFLSLNLIRAPWRPMSDFHPLTERTPLSLLGLGHASSWPFLRLWLNLSA
ncbi:hypothetical protein BDP81DRAFT_506712 [Colletotrichum phormii]|uniref:Uncharacterized protein n=1 Tax=Colletotrichum phormii TaxID=359342 RepID=A0AAJ0E8M3_9PEZI|nr:uncharacterized protein BDP81DRAFT_506712 [Colletotrichum phormii]KAK1622741.1 hypothetical protein BDP81DRAFT_506712 [Colletotrichum phormii]